MRSGTISLDNPDELDIAQTLSSGQVFRWTEKSQGLWKGMIGPNRVYLQVAPGPPGVAWTSDAPDPDNMVRRFLRLDDLPLAETASGWADSDPLLADAWKRNPGLRILRQDRNECFFSFLLASAAPVARISHMCHALAARYGNPVGDSLFEFPGPEALARANESDLRALGLGFRAPRIVAAARFLAERSGFLEQLPTADRDALHDAFRELPGIGPKITDCIALFAFDCDTAVPVDTHVWRITKDHLDPGLAGKSLTAANYARARDAWIRQYGNHAGWAQQILFHDAAQRRLRS